MGAFGEGPLAGGALDVATFTPGLAIDMAEGVALAPASSYRLYPGGAPHDGANVHDAYTPLWTFAPALAEAVKVGFTPRVAWAVAVLQALRIQGSALGLFGSALVQALKARDKFIASVVSRLSLAERLELLQSTAFYDTLDFGDGFGVHSLLACNYAAGASVAERAVLSGALDDRLVLRLDVDDAVEWLDHALLCFIWSTGIDETIQASILYQSPGSGVAAWAINTRTNAVTEYRNFAFNSFAFMGRRYIAADSDGLYELDGARDLTRNVASELAGGFFAAGGSTLGGFKACYIGMRSSGEFLLKLESGDGRTYIYRAVASEGLATTKVNLGKGLRSRYFAWELLADGQDFDLDSIEFVPMVSARRV